MDRPDRSSGATDIWDEQEAEEGDSMHNLEVHHVCIPKDGPPQQRYSGDRQHRSHAGDLLQNRDDYSVKLTGQGVADTMNIRVVHLFVEDCHMGLLSQFFQISVDLISIELLALGIPGRDG